MAEDVTPPEASGLVAQLRAYLQHKSTCMGRYCSTCGHQGRWLDGALRCTGCSQFRQQLCTCGLDALIASSPTTAATAAPAQAIGQVIAQVAKELRACGDSYEAQAEGRNAEDFEFLMDLAALVRKWADRLTAPPSGDLVRTDPQD